MFLNNYIAIENYFNQILFAISSIIVVKYEMQTNFLKNVLIMFVINLFFIFDKMGFYSNTLF